MRFSESGVLGKLDLGRDFRKIGFGINGILGKCIFEKKEFWEYLIMGFNLYFFYKD